MKILLLADPMVNAKQWIYGLEKYGNAEVINWHLENRGKVKRTLEWLKMLLTLKSKVKKENPDIIIGYRLTSYGFLAAWSGYKPCVLAAQGITDVWPEHHWTTPFKAFLAKYAIARADMIHAWGEHMATDIIKHGGEKEQIFIMPRGVDTNIFFAPAAIEKNIEKDTLTLTVTRALYPEYGHMVILKAFKKLIDDNYKVELNIAGVGSEQEKINDYIATNNLKEQVHMLGFVPNTDLPQLLRHTDIYISMPETEGVSNSLFEAMACGCFPVLSDLPANRAIIKDNETGYLIPVGDDVALYSKIKAIINNPSILKIAGEKNHNYICAHASLQKNMQSFVKEYEQLILNKKNYTPFAM